MIHLGAGTRWESWARTLQRSWGVGAEIFEAQAEQNHPRAMGLVVAEYGGGPTVLEDPSEGVVGGGRAGWNPIGFRGIL